MEELKERQSAVDTTRPGWRQTVLSLAIIVSGSFTQTLEHGVFPAAAMTQLMFTII